MYKFLRIVTTIFFTCASFSTVFGQNDYYVTWKGDTIRGQLRNVLLRGITFKSENEKDFTIIPISQVHTCKFLSWPYYQFYSIYFHVNSDSIKKSPNLNKRDTLIFLCQECGKLKIVPADQKEQVYHKHDIIISRINTNFFIMIMKDSSWACIGRNLMGNMTQAQVVFFKTLLADIPEIAEKVKFETKFTYKKLLEIVADYNKAYAHRKNE